MPTTTAPPRFSEKQIAAAKETAKLLGQLMIHRRDAKAIYGPDARSPEDPALWHWTAIKEKFTLDDFQNHLFGDACLGTYLLHPDDSTVKFIAFDLDMKDAGSYLVIRNVEEVMELESQGYYENEADHEIDLDLKIGNLEAALHLPFHEAHRWARIILLTAIRGIVKTGTSRLGIKPMTVITGGGAHVIFPLPEPTPATDARAMGLDVMEYVHGASRKGNGDIFWNYGNYQNVPLEIEVFPKQDSLDGKKFGNLIRLPFGWHHEAQMRTFAMDPLALITPLWDWQKLSGLTVLRQMAGA
jgi:hypothetical protein